jgi:hypothetical protein
LIRDHVAAVERLLGEGRVDYLMVDTSKPIDEVCSNTCCAASAVQSVR